MHSELHELASDLNQASALPVSNNYQVQLFQKLQTFEFSWQEESYCQNKTVALLSFQMNVAYSCMCVGAVVGSVGTQD